MSTSAGARRLHALAMPGEGKAPDEQREPAAPITFVEGSEPACCASEVQYVTEPFVKISIGILTSSLWLEALETKILFLTCVFFADSQGVVHASVGGLAHAAGISREACIKGLERLMAPDPDSRNPDFDGRRVRCVEGGFLVLSYLRHRNRRTISMAKNAERQRRFRARAGSRTASDSQGGNT